MANIHEMYGVECERHENTEEGRVYLLKALADLKNGKIELAQLEFPTTGGIRIIPLSELPPGADEEAKPEAADALPPAIKGTGEPEAE